MRRVVQQQLVFHRYCNAVLTGNSYRTDGGGGEGIRILTVCKRKKIETPFGVAMDMKKREKLVCVPKRSRRLWARGTLDTPYRRSAAVAHRDDGSITTYSRCGTRDAVCDVQHIKRIQITRSVIELNVCSWGAL